MTTAATWYPPSCGTGGFLSDALLFSNPPFVNMTNITALLDWVLDHQLEHDYCHLITLLDLARMWERGTIGPDIAMPNESFQARWLISKSAVGIRLNRLRHAGLIAYTTSKASPGYRFQRIGPEP